MHMYTYIHISENILSRPYTFVSLIILFTFNSLFWLFLGFWCPGNLLFYADDSIYWNRTIDRCWQNKARDTFYYCWHHVRKKCIFLNINIYESLEQSSCLKMHLKIILCSWKLTFYWIASYFRWCAERTHYYMHFLSVNGSIAVE